MLWYLYSSLIIDEKKINSLFLDNKNQTINFIDQQNMNNKVSGWLLLNLYHLHSFDFLNMYILVYFFPTIDGSMEFV